MPHCVRECISHCRLLDLGCFGNGIVVVASTIVARNGQWCYFYASLVSCINECSSCKGNSYVSSDWTRISSRGRYSKHDIRGRRMWTRENVNECGIEREKNNQEQVHVWNKFLWDIGSAECRILISRVKIQWEAMTRWTKRSYYIQNALLQKAAGWWRLLTLNMWLDLLRYI
jgi:hypothetical protein